MRFQEHHYWTVFVQLYLYGNFTNHYNIPNSKMGKRFGFDSEVYFIFYLLKDYFSNIIVAVDMI